MKQYHVLEACSIMKLYEAQMSYKMNWFLHKVDINKSCERVVRISRYLYTSTCSRI